jgi:hypothetical protein
MQRDSSEETRLYEGSVDDLCELLLLLMMMQMMMMCCVQA